MKPNRMKEKMARGEPALGCSVMFPSPQIVEMLGYAGFDWVLIDCEHGSIGPADVEFMAMASDAVGITPIARPRTNAVSDIQSVMDRGVMGVQVPHVDTAEEARRTVAAVKFGPGAARGLAAGTRPDRWGLGARMPDFTAAANAQSLVCVQLERQGVDLRFGLDTSGRAGEQVEQANPEGRLDPLHKTSLAGDPHRALDDEVDRRYGLAFPQEERPSAEETLAGSLREACKLVCRQANEVR